MCLMGKHNQVGTKIPNNQTDKVPITRWLILSFITAGDGKVALPTSVI